MEESVVSGVGSYFALYMVIAVASILLISVNEYDFTTTVTAVLACFNNIGPGLELVGPMGGYAPFNAFSKIILTLDMLMGRLEIIPLIMLASPAVWRRGKAKGSHDKKGSRHLITNPKAGETGPRVFWLVY